jgi:phage host-nuclease inhibitor protein Gam
VRAVTQLGTWIKSEGNAAATWVQSEIATLTAALPATLQNITNTVNSDIAAWQNWIASETTRLNNLVQSTTASIDSDISAWQNWLSSYTATFNQDIQSLQTYITTVTNNYNSVLTSDAQRLDASLSTQCAAIYTWYQNAWNALSAGVNDATSWVQNTIDNLDGGQWESDIGLSLAGNPCDTLTQTYNKIIASLQAEAQSTYNSDIANAKSQLTSYINNANAQIAAFNQQIQSITTEANNNIAEFQNQLASDLASIASTLSAETAQANTTIANLKAALPGELATAKAALATQISKLQADVPSLTTEVDNILSGLDMQLAQSYVSAIASDPDGNLAAMPAGLTTILMFDATNQMNTVFASVL